MQARTAKDVIDEAIRENRFGEALLYFFAILFVLVGVTILVYGALQNQPVTAIVGFASTSLFWPAMTSARRTRRENIAIRLLEAPLGRADTDGLGTDARQVGLARFVADGHCHGQAVGRRVKLV